MLHPMDRSIAILHTGQDLKATKTKYDSYYFLVLKLVTNTGKWIAQCKSSLLGVALQVLHGFAFVFER